MKTTLSLAFLLLASCAAPAADGETPSCCSGDDAMAASPADAAVPRDSLYLLPESWHDQDARETRLADLQGEVVVAAMVFTHCQYACPIILSDLKEIEAQVPAEARADVRWLLVSMDSERDVPAVLRDYADRNELDARWTLLHGDAEAVRSIAAVLGIDYQRDSAGNFAHSNKITVLDRAGRIAHQAVGLHAKAEPTIQAILDQVDGG